MLTLYVFPRTDFLLLMAQGRLDALGAETFDKKTESAYEMSRYWVLDCSKLQFLSSAGIRSLLQVAKKLHSHDGELLLLSPGEQVKQVLDMSGLLEQFILCQDMTEAEEKVQKISSRHGRIGSFSLQNRSYTLKALSTGGSEVIQWKKAHADDFPALVSLQELGVSIGRGCMAENQKQAMEVTGVFLSFPGFFYFSPDNKTVPSDYFLGKSDAPQGFYISQAFSVKGEPAYLVDIQLQSDTKLNVIAAEISQLIAKWDGKMPALMHFTGLTEDNNLVMGFYSNEEMLMANKGTNQFWGSGENTTDYFLQAASFHCAEDLLSPGLSDFHSIPSLLNNIDPAHQRLMDGDPAISGIMRCWIFTPEKMLDERTNRLEIVYEDDIETPEEWELIIREIYKDAGKVVLKQLHGGFSAKTFQVVSFNREGKRTIPTVLKLGQVPIVEREERNYRIHVQQYILNNSTTIMGAHYYGEWGGVRYNFLGINGPETRLKWLTHVYKERNSNELVPLFDRIFKSVLKPWYGQPKLESLKLWESHNPMIPFFPGIINDAERLLGISADEESMDCPYLGRKILNPYWFLKHEWPGKMDESRLWYSSVCHGDLNMQNILLDETDNIYIIDFSETHPRNIVSDFARLEPIFKIEMTRTSREEDLRDKLMLEEALLNIEKLTDQPSFRYSGDDAMIHKAYNMILNMRKYARMTMIFDEDPVPYWLAVLEWTLPYVSYWSVPIQMQWHSAYSAGLILERIMKK